MKTLYVLTSNNGDGSSSVCATFDGELIKEMEAKYESRSSEFDYEKWSDGDGFHYDTWTLPDECTYESMGIHFPLTREDIFYE